MRTARQAPAAQQSARARVCWAISGQIRRFPDLELTPLDTSGLDERDAALAHVIHDGVLRRWLTLWHLIARGLDRPGLDPPPKAIAALLVGAAQLVLLERVPVHAAVNESVEWTKINAGMGASRLVNAVLRTVADLVGPDNAKTRRPGYDGGLDELPLSDGTSLILTKPMMPTDPVQRLAVATSVPTDLLRAWTKHASLREARRLAMHALVAPPTIVNTAHARGDLPLSLRPHTLPGHHVFTGTHAELSALLSERRDLWVQDPGSSLAVSTVSDLRPKVVVDACAGLGTKTRQLAHTFPDATVVATDIDLLRQSALREATRGLANVTVVGHRELATWAGKADLVLLDVPCSNTGVLARRVEARYRFGRESQDQLTAMQRQIIADALILLAPGPRRGRILYSTCSLDPAENQGQAAWAEKWHSMRGERERARAPQGLAGEAPEGYSDGAYAVVLQ